MSEYIKEKKIININSNDATIFNNGSFLSDLKFSFPNIISRDDDVEYLEGGLDSAVFPVSFYIVNYSNHILNYTIFHLGVYTNYSITIPVGNYDYKTLFTSMIDAFHLNGHTFVLTLNEINGIITMEYKKTGDRIFHSINHVSSTCFRILGFDYRTDYYPVADILIAPFALNLLGIKKLKIYCPQFSSSNLDSTNYATTAIISTIINDQAPWGQINYYNTTGETGSKLRVFEMNNIDIRVTDEYGNLINFNNCDWSMTFVLSTFRRGNYNAIRKMTTLNENEPIETAPIVETKTSDEIQRDLPEEPEIIEDPNVVDLDFLMKTNPNYFN